METTRTTGVTVTATAADEVRRYIEENGAGETAGLRIGVLRSGQRQPCELIDVATLLGPIFGRPETR